MDINEISLAYGPIYDINILIYEAFEQIRDLFFDENEKAIEALGFDISAAEF